MLKPTNWKGSALKGVWEVTYKIDGVRALITDGVALSRNGKPLYNLQDIPDGDYEVYLGSWEASVSAVRTQHGAPPVKYSSVYDLKLAEKLHCCMVEDPTAEKINELMEAACESGKEGLVLRQGDIWIKVKPIENYDIRIDGLREGKGRNAGRLGAFITARGNVGSGLTDRLRDLYWDESLVGATIEVECWELTPAGKFRHPRFKRLRFDKDAGGDN